MFNKHAVSWKYYSPKESSTLAKRIGLILFVALLAGCQSAVSKVKQEILPLPPESGVDVMQVDFTYERNRRLASDWGRILITQERIKSTTDIEGGFLNVVTEKGWAVRNLPIPPLDQPSLSVYFDLAIPRSGIRIEEIDLKITVSSQPVGKPDKELAEVNFTRYPVSVWLWNAKGVGPMLKEINDPPPATAPMDSAVPAGKETFAHYQQVVNVETATNQCIPMSIANSLQFLENQGKVKIPHTHSIGLKGDKTLVGQLDTACDRKYVTKRTDGQGVCFKPMVDGVFKYYKDNKLTSKLDHSHQGRGWCDALPSGNYAKHGSTTQDDGATPTWNWMCERIKDGCGLEAVFRYSNSSGGHAVRVTGCGMSAGSEWIRYSHDSQQTDQDPKDANGLEHVLVYPIDLNNDGFLNFDSFGRELEFVFAQCP